MSDEADSLDHQVGFAVRFCRRCTQKHIAKTAVTRSSTDRKVFLLRRVRLKMQEL